MKKTISMILSVLLILSSIPMLSLTAIAEDSEKPFDEAVELKLNEDAELTVDPESYYYYKFTPEKEGLYQFYSMGDLDTKAALYNDNKELVIENDDSSFEDLNFGFSYYCQGGATYYLEVTSYSEESGTCFICVSDPMDGVESISVDGLSDLVVNFNGYYDWSLDRFIYFTSAGDLCENEDFTLNLDYGDDYVESFKHGEFDLSYLTITDNQLDEAWDIGPHEVTVEYFGFETTATVNVIENPVKSISVEGLNHLTENFGGNEFDGKFYYFIDRELLIDSPDFKLTVNYIDGSIDVFDFIDYKDSFALQDLLLINDTQDDKPFTVGNNTLKASYMGVECDVAIVVDENPVKAISIVGTNSLIENLTGSYDEYLSATGEFDKIFKYYTDFDALFNNPNFEIKFDYKDGSSKTMNYQQFMNCGLMDYFDIECDPYNWKVGNDNKVTIYYLGVSTEIDITVLANNIDSIAVEGLSSYLQKFDAVDYIYDEEYGHTYGYYYDDSVLGLCNNKNFKLTVTNKDGSSTEYSFDDAYYNGIFDNLNILSYQFESSWEPYTENTVEFEYAGAFYETDVEIIPADVESFSVSGLSNVFENDLSNGTYINYGRWNQYFEYDLGVNSLIANENFVFTLNLFDGSSYDYTYLDFLSKVGFADSSVDIIPITQSYKNQLELGENDVTFVFDDLEYSTTFNIVQSNIKSFSITGLRSFVENDFNYGYFVTETYKNSVGLYYFVYNTMSLFSDDTVLTVTFDNGTVKNYDYSDLVIAKDGLDLFWNDMQEEKHWYADADNNLKLILRGVEIEVPVTIKHAFKGDLEVKQPTDTEDGYEKGYCNVCKKDVVTILPKTGHTPTKPTVKPTGTTVKPIAPTTSSKKITLKKPVIKLKAAKKKLTVTFNKIAKAQKYTVQYRVKGAKKWKTKVVKKTKVVLKKLKGGKKYQVRVRAVTKQNGKTIYGSYSKVKTIKVKK